MSQAASPPPAIGGLHDDHVVALLRSGAHATLLAAYFGEVEYRELCQLAKLAATRRNERGPLVFVLPGIMGSRLGLRRGKAIDLLWLHPAAVHSGGLRQLALPGARGLKALGVMLPGYLKLKLSLEIAGYRPMFHPFDWRLDLERLGRYLNQSIAQSGAREVLIVAHSMGGLVARAALAGDGQRRISRLVQLGAPNDGSFAPVQALRAVYPTVRKIAALDGGHTAEELTQHVFRTLPGLYQMLPSPAAGCIDLFDPASWPDDALKPDAKLLARARRNRQRLPVADTRCLLIAGVNQETVTAIEKHSTGFSYRYTRDGDGTVPVALAHWTGAATWYAEAAHGAMTADNAVISAVIDLLESGSTARLTQQRPAANATATREMTDGQLRTQATTKVAWDSLSLDSRRRILEPVISAEFL